MRTLLFVAAMAAVLSSNAADMQYWPNGATASAPYAWTNAANWAEKVKTPTASLDRVPTTGDTVYLAANELSASPLVITNGDSITVATVYLGAGDNDSATPTALYGKGQGTWLKMFGGSLTTTGNFNTGDHNYQWSVFDLIGGTVTVGGNMTLGQGNAYATSPSRLVVSPGATLNVAGTMTVGGRTSRGLTVVTNEGAIAVGNLALGPNNTSYYSHSSFCNASGGSLAITGELNVPGSGKTGTKSSGELHLNEGSTIAFSGTKVSIGGAPGSGLLVCETDADFSSATSFYVGNNNTSTGTLRIAKSAFVKTREIVLANAQNGGVGVLEMEDSSVLDAGGSTVGTSIANVDAHIRLHDSARITNVNHIALGVLVGGRLRARGHLYMDGSSEIVMAPGGDRRTVWGGSQSNGWMDVTLAGSSAIRGLKVFGIGYGVVNTASNPFNRGGDVTLAGGTIEFDVSSEDGSLYVGGSGSTTYMLPVATMHGYGMVTRADAAAPSGSHNVNLTMPAPIWSITADGGGAMRDLDLRAVFKSNGSANYGNKSGTNGWFAVAGGRMLYPRAYPLKYVNNNPIRGIGEYPDLGKTSVPTLINSATVRVPSTFEDSYLYAALYATDRSDVPGGIPVGDGATIAVWRLGLAEDWKADDPASPKAFSNLPFTFCYDVRDIPDRADVDKVCLWRHDGSAGGSWRRIATVRPEVDAVTGDKTWPSTIAATLSSCDQTWNGGFLAIGAPTGCGLIFVFR